MKKFNLVVVFVFGCIFTAFSQVPGAFNYQSVVRNSSGDIIANTSVSFRVSILQNSEIGSPVYVETQNTTTNSFGLVSLKIGRGTVVSGNLENAAWGTAPHFIKVEVDPAGGSAYSLLGTSELLSVPYALQAENVSNNQTLSVSGNELSISDGNTVTLPASGSSLWTASGDNIYRSSGFVGIGTTTPSAPLEIKSNNEPSLIIGSASSNDTTRPGIKFINNTSHYIAADDGSDEIFGFYSNWSNTRTYDAKLRVHGKADGSWGKYLAITHNGTDGEITTDTGALKLSPANGEVIINGEVIRSFTNTLIHTHGNNNFFAGENAGNLTMDGTSNTGGGSSALHSNTTGQDNTACGRSALYKNTIGNLNTASGDQVLYFNTTGQDNTACGRTALHKNTTGGFNTASGISALYENTTGNFNTACGSQTLFNNISGNYNTAIGYNAGHIYATGSSNTFIGAYSDAAANNLTNATAIGYDATVTGSNQVRIGNDDVTQIGGHAPWSNTSDTRKKKDISDVPLGLDFITALRPVQFRMREGNDRLDFGFIAQDIEALLGEDYNILGIGGDPDRTLSLRYTDFISPMVKAMQEQQWQIEEQQEIIDVLKSENIQLKANNTEIISRLEKLENLMSVSAQK